MIQMVYNQQDKTGIIVVVFLVIIGIIGLVVAADFLTKNQRMIRETKNLVKQISNRFDEDESFIDHMETIPKDSWGTPVTIGIDGETIKTCSVTSAGPDKLFDTDDDIKDSNTNFHLKIDVKEAGKSVGKAGGEFGIGFIKSAYQAVKDEFKK